MLNIHGLVGDIVTSWSEATACLAVGSKALIAGRVTAEIMFATNAPSAHKKSRPVARAAW
jgi:hypothetical protein